jgi:hypothetical protein
MASERGITLERRRQTNYVSHDTECYRVTIAARNPRDMEQAIFRYRELPVEPGQADRLGFFDGICRPQELEDLPINAPQVNADPPWYRLDFVDVLLNSQEQGAEFLAQVEADVASLVSALDTADELDVLEDVWVGTGEPPAVSSSSSGG